MSLNDILNGKRDIRKFERDFSELLKARIGDKLNPLIIIHGGFGKNNTGDDSLLVTIKNKVLETYPKARIVAFCFNPDLLKRYYKIDGVNFKSREAFKLLFKCDALIAGNGGLVNQLYSSNPVKNLFNPRGKFIFFTLFITNLRRKPTVVYLVGINKIPSLSVKLLMYMVLPFVDLLGVRDYESCCQLKKMGIKKYFFGYDPVFRLKADNEKITNINDFYKKWGVQSRSYIIVNFRYTKSADESSHAQVELVLYIHELLQIYPEKDIILYPFAIDPNIEIENDVISMGKLRDELSHCYGDKIILVDEYQTYLDVKAVMKHAEMLVLARHHALILSSEFMKPLIVLSYDSKVRQVAELIDAPFIFDYHKLNHQQLIKATQCLLSTDKEMYKNV